MDTRRIRKLREERAWSQDDLARESGLNPRTIQRIEQGGTASLQSQRALAAAFDLDPSELGPTDGPTMTPCPECRSDDVFRCRDLVDSTTIGGELLPKLSSRKFSSARLRPVVCAGCGFVRFFVDGDARSRLASSSRWERV